MNYRKNNYTINNGLVANQDEVLTAANLTNSLITQLPPNLFQSIDYKTTSAMIGAVFCQNLANTIENAIVNPIEKGHPDIIPVAGLNSSEEVLRNYPHGIEIKCTVGNISQGSNLRAGYCRLDNLTGITWQAHHQEVEHLLGLVWDFCNNLNNFNYPAISGAFYSKDLTLDDWGAISGTTGRNTKVCGMKASGRNKMGRGWIIINEPHFERYSQILNIHTSEF